MSQPVDSTASASGLKFVLFHLSGLRRGAADLLSGDEPRIGVAAGSTIQLPNEEPQVEPHHATLHRRGDTYELEAIAPGGIWVNGERVERVLLESGDLIEVGPAGPLLRFRAYPASSDAYKSAAEAFSDCVACASSEEGGPLRRAFVFLTTIPRELLTQTSVRFRAVVLLLIAALTALLIHQILRGERLERRLEDQAMQVTGLAELLEQTERSALRAEDLALIEAELGVRLEALEYRSEAAGRIIGEASASVVFLQGGYGYAERESGRLLRFQTGDDGAPALGPDGEPRVDLTGDGPPVEALLTGTGFITTDRGLILTNKHVALPWEFDRMTTAMRSQGLEPRMLRMLAYLPGVPEPEEVEFVAASEEADVALLRCHDPAKALRSLALSETAPLPGDEVFVLGYPTGVRALLARADESFVRDLMTRPRIDFWEVARALGARNYIAPLATRGIVGQVTNAAVVYDAETTSGGSGGPVVDTDGRVVAINTAILPEFGGSNIGVPAGYARRLIEAALADERGDVE